MTKTQTTDPVWEKLFSTQEWGKYPPEHIVRFIARNFYKAPDRSAVRLLDVGCGPGANAWFMAREGFRVSGIDGSPTAVQIATERISKEGRQAELVLGDIVELPWPDNTFDGAIDNFCLCANRHETISQALSEIHRVLKPGGKFLSGTFTTNCWGYGSGREVAADTFVDASEGVVKDRGLLLYISEERLHRLLADFKIVEICKESRSVDNMRHAIESWIAICEKPAR